jgi:hypothetical protein
MNRRTLALIAILTTLAATQPGRARAQTEAERPQHRNGALGFHDFDAPLGGRWWFGGQKVGLDLGVGFQSDPAPSYPDEHLTSLAFAAGIPIVLKSWRQVHVLFRPGFFYESSQAQATSPPVPFDTESQKTIRVTGELEAEAFLLDNFSVSASHGIGWNQFDPGFGADKETSFGTLGKGFTEVGFHVYLFGGE